MPEDTVAIRIMLRGEAAAASGIRSVGDAMQSLGAKARVASAESGNAFSRMNTGMKDAIGSLWYLKYVAGAALGSAAVSAVKTGVQFDATMESNTVAFQGLLGSVAAARTEVNTLFQVAAHTPFDFPGVTSAARRFLAFGFSVHDANRELRIIGDAIAGMGGSSADLERFVTVIGQIRASGFLHGQDLMQLEQFGVISRTDIARRLNMSGSQFTTAMMNNQITAPRAIGAINATLQSRFHGAAAAQSRTFGGQLSTLQDNLGQALGKLAEPLFNFLRDKIFPGFNKFLSGGGLTRAVGVAETAVKRFITALRPAAPFFQNILGPLLKGLAETIIGVVVTAFVVLLKVTQVVAPILGAIGRAARPLRGTFELIGKALGFVFGGAILKVIGELPLLGRALGLLRGPFGLMERLLTRLQRAFVVVGAIAIGAFNGIKNAITAALNFMIRQVDAVIGSINSIPDIHTPLGNIGIPNIAPIAQIGQSPRRTARTGGGGGISGPLPATVVSDRQAQQALANLNAHQRARR